MIVVVGGGIGGLTAALAIRRAGLDAQVFERAAELREVGAGIALWLNALRSLDSLDLAEAVRRFSVPQPDAGLRTWDGRVLVAPSKSLRARLGDLGLVVHRASLQSVLADAVGRENIHLDRTCTGVEHDASGALARFSDGSIARGVAVIGADGLHSVVRAALHGNRPPRYAGYTSWRSVVQFDHRQLLIGESWGHGRRFGQVPMADGQVYWFAAATAPAGERAADGERALLRRLFAGWHAPIESLIDATTEPAILRVDIYDRPVLARWGAGRVTLLGDAAHPMTPNLGQGACQAIEDAVALGRALGDVPDVAAALRVYEARRIKRANAIVLASRRIGVIAQLSNPVAVGVRNFVVRHLGPWMQDRQLEGVIGR